MLNIEEREQCNSFYDAEIGYFIAFLKVICQKTKFEDRVAQLVIFSDVSIFSILFVLFALVRHCSFTHLIPSRTIMKNPSI